MKALMTIESTAAVEKRLPLMIPTLSAAAAITILVLLLLLFSGGVLALWPVIVVVAFAVALAHTVMLGIPYVLLLRRLDRLSILPMLLGGFAIGFIPTAILVWPEAVPAAVAAALAGAMGAVGAVTFHLSCRQLSAQAQLQR